MSATGLEVFDKSIQTTNIWLDEIMEDMGPDRQLAWHLLGAVLRTMRDRLPSGSARAIAAGGSRRLLRSIRTVRVTGEDEIPGRLPGQDRRRTEVQQTDKHSGRSSGRLFSPGEACRRRPDREGLGGTSPGHKTGCHGQASFLNFALG